MTSRSRRPGTSASQEDSSTDEQSPVSERQHAAFQGPFTFLPPAMPPTFRSSYVRRSASRPLERSRCSLWAEPEASAPGTHRHDRRFVLANAKSIRGHAVRGRAQPARSESQAGTKAAGYQPPRRKAVSGDRRRHPGNEHGARIDALHQPALILVHAAGVAATSCGLHTMSSSAASATRSASFGHLKSSLMPRPFAAAVPASMTSSVAPSSWML